MNINTDQLKILTDILKENFVGGRLSKIGEIEKGVFYFEIKKKLLIFTSQPNCSYLALSERIPSRGEISSFGMLLRKHLNGAFVIDIGLVNPDDRVVEISFSRENFLIVELSGRHGNIFILDEKRVILGSWVKNKSQKRDLRTGNVYVAPDHVFSHETKCDCLTLREHPDYFLRMHLSEIKESLIQKVTRENEKIVKRKKKLLSNLTMDIEKAEIELLWKRHGDLFLMTINEWSGNVREKYFSNPPDGMEPLTLKLPVGIHSASAAADFFYRKYKKARRTIDVLSERIEIIKNDLETLENDFDAEEAVTNIMKESGKQSSTAKSIRADRSSKGKTSSHFREFLSSDGIKIIVGRTAVENHKLTFRVANGEDYWFHIRDFSGPHVIALTGKKELTQETLLDAASLAVFYSDARKNGGGDVIYTRRKYLKPVKGSPGKVTVASSSNRSVKLDDIRVQRIFKSRL
ncbi:MAG: DUF814 domain-containing protein [Deltaproteobacteria bacterium]|nr:DUF814 domain-containing protein [Deltaproteobacteria bacterium]